MNPMRARQFVAITALHAAPAGPDATPGDRADVLADALRGVILGGWDEIILARLVHDTDIVTLRTLVSWLERIREQGNVEAIDVETALRANRGVAPVPRYGHHPQGYTDGWISGTCDG